MALLLLAGLAELAEAATTIAEGAAGAQAIAVEMGAITEATPMLAPLAAGEDAAVSTAYGTINVTGRAAQAYQNATQAYAAAALVVTTTAEGARKVWDSAQKANEKRKAHRDYPTRKKLRFDTLDSDHVNRVIKPGRAEGLEGFPNSFTATMHAFRPVVTC